MITIDDLENELSDQLPALMPPIQAGALTPLPNAHLLPPLIAEAGEQASWRYIDFFTANIRNSNTRRAYARACHTFFAWCDERGLKFEHNPSFRC